MDNVSVSISTRRIEQRYLLAKEKTVHPAQYMMRRADVAAFQTQARYPDYVTPARCDKAKKPSADEMLQADGLKEWVLNPCK